MTASWSQPRDGQTESRLLQLPLELRLKVLRYLHISDELFQALDVPNDYPSACVNRDTVQLSTQALQTCQQLYQECCEVLYGENVISVNVCRSPTTYDSPSEHVQLATFACTIRASITCKSQ